MIVGLRSEAVRIATPADARPGETHITGLVEHVEFQGHEVLVHFNTGSRLAVVPELEAPRPGRRPPRRRRREGGVLDRLRKGAGGLRTGAVDVLDEPSAQEALASPEARPSATSSCAPLPTSTSATGCRSRSSSTSPISSSSTSTASASARLRPGCRTSTSERASRGVRGPAPRVFRVLHPSSPGARKLTALV